MIEKKDPSEVQQMVDKRRKLDVSFLCLLFQRKGTLFLLDTENGSQYLFEVVSRWKSTAHIFRLQGGFGTPLGYRRIENLLPVIVKGLDFRRAGDRGTCVSRIRIIRPEPKLKRSRGRRFHHA